MGFKSLKPETRERVRREHVELQEARRAAFLANYNRLQREYGLSEPPSEGAVYNGELSDGRVIVITPNGVSVF